MTTTTLPAPLEAYFADLDRALTGTDPRERAETLQTMREDAAEMLARHGNTDKTAERVIAEFGPVEQIAASATPQPAATRPWTDIWLLACSIASLALYVFPLVPAAVLAWAIVRVKKHTGNRTLQKAALSVSAASTVFAIGLLIAHYMH